MYLGNEIYAAVLYGAVFGMVFCLGLNLNILYGAREYVGLVFRSRVRWVVGVLIS